MVTSPNHPDNYPNNLEKTDTIQVEQGLIISLEFTAFYIEDHSNCLFDHLTITDGDGTTLMEKSCGTGASIVIGGEHIGFSFSLPPAIRSRTNSVKLVFTTNGISGYPGWVVRWLAVSPGDCQQHVWIFLENIIFF